MKTDLQTREEWRDLKGFEKYYSISNYGHIYSKRMNKIMRQKKIKKGYMVIRLKVNNKLYKYFVHVLVANTFLGDTSGKQVHHIDHNRSNNNVDNLMIVTREEHTKIHRGNVFVTKKCIVCGKEYKTYRIKPKNTCSSECWKEKQKIIQYSKDGKFIRIWDNMQEICDTLDIDKSNICTVCKHKMPSYKGYIWRYAYENEKCNTRRFE